MEVGYGRKYTNEKYINYSLVIFLFLIGLTFVIDVFAEEAKAEIDLTVISSEGVDLNETFKGEHGVTANVWLVV